MRDHQGAKIRAAHRVDAVGNDFQCVNVQSRVGFVHQCEARLEHQHLQDLIAFFLAARKALVEVAVDPALVPIQYGQRLLQFSVELHELDFLPRAGLNGEAQEVGDGYAGDFDRVLERQIQTFAGALVGFHL